MKTSLKENTAIVESMNTKGIRISLDEVIKISNKYNLKILGNNVTKAKGDCTHFVFDKITIYGERLMFRQENGSDNISFQITDITDILYIEGDFINFSLNNDEEWIISLCGEEGNRNPRPYEIYDEIEIDEFLEKLEESREICVSHVQGQITTTTHFDTVYIEDINDNITLIFSDTRNPLLKGSVDLDNSVIYSTVDGYGFSTVYIGLYDTPFTDVILTMYYFRED